MATIEDIKKLLESKSFTSARDLDEFEEKPDDKLDEVRLSCDPSIGLVEKEGENFIKILNILKSMELLGQGYTYQAR